MDGLFSPRNTSLAVVTCSANLSAESQQMTQCILSVVTQSSRKVAEVVL